MLTLSAAQAMLEAGLARARDGKHRVTIAIVDSGGFVVAMARMDGAAPATPDIALGKAGAAALMRRPSGELGQRWAPGAPIPTAMAIRTGGRFIAHQGALPFLEGDQAIGAVGVSGAPSDQDEAIAQAAIDAFRP